MGSKDPVIAKARQIGPVEQKRGSGYPYPRAVSMPRATAKRDIPRQFVRHTSGTTLGRPTREGAAMSSIEPEAPVPDGPATTLLASVAHGLSVVCEPRAVRQRFEEELCALVRARSVGLR